MDELEAETNLTEAGDRPHSSGRGDASLDL